MTKTIAILATLDTKSDECAFLAEEISRLGAKPFLIDIGVVGVSKLAADIPANEIAELGGTSLVDLRANPSRETASKVMVDGATRRILDLLTSGEIHGIIGLGGTQGTANCTQVMQALPYGFPKVMLSTMASGDTSGYVGIKDITMMFSVADILGLNPLFRAIVSNAAGAVVGMANAYQPISFDPSKPVIGITNLGVLTQGTMKAMEKFAEQGFETIVFHAVGSGGRAMEQLMRDGLIQAVFDYALGDIVDDIGGGIRAADESRLTVAAALGLPQVVVPGGTDHLGILLDTPNSLPSAYADRAYTYHNPVILVPRTSVDEMIKLASIVAERTNVATGPTHILVPNRGLSSYSVPGGPLEDSAADTALAQGLVAQCSNPVTIVDANAEDEDFINLAVATLVDLMTQRHGE
ncbi:Tm-1-like ATP-binding domain-containing protein [Ahrensia kielensis]|uniref:Tm-1-like ATP-binding domain-containing protein n=1 Tax=Ahrensia kielensis TaxID=76980 RepID=UPI0003812C3F|nr:Tm-1-like ATP-binding domain-containing protein [Ahrensia kielensis]